MINSRIDSPQTGSLVSRDHQPIMRGLMKVPPILASGSIVLDSASLVLSVHNAEASP
jgi:hypothetical protein